MISDKTVITITNLLANSLITSLTGNNIYSIFITLVTVATEELVTAINLKRNLHFPTLFPICS